MMGYVTMCIDLEAGAYMRGYSQPPTPMSRDRQTTSGTITLPPKRLSKRLSNA